MRRMTGFFSFLENLVLLYQHFTDIDKMLSMNDMASRTFFYQAIRSCTRSLYDQPWCCFRSSKFMKIKRRDCDRILFEKATQGASKLHFITFFNQRTRFSKGRKETSHSPEICLDKKGQKRTQTERISRTWDFLLPTSLPVKCVSWKSTKRILFRSHFPYIYIYIFFF